MGILLGKGQAISLTKNKPGLSEVFFGLGWDVPSDSGVEFDLDAFAFLIGANEKLISDSHLIFYNNLISPDPNQSVEHMGDNSTGVGEGDDEVIKVNLKRVPAEIKKLLFAVTIFEGEERKQNFGQVKNAFVRLVDETTQEEIMRYNLEDSFSGETVVLMAELYRQDGGWAVNALGTPYPGGAQALIDAYIAPPESSTVRQPVINWRYRTQQSR